MDKKVLEVNSRVLDALKAKFGQTIDVSQYGLAEPVIVYDQSDGVTVPMIIFPNGEAIEVFAETDKHELLMYHKLQNVSRKEKSGFGSRRVFDETGELSIIVFGKRKRSQFEVERCITDAIMVDKNGTVTTSDFNAVQVFANEYTGQSYFLGTKYFLFKINYSLTCTRNDGCENQ